MGTQLILPAGRIPGTRKGPAASETHSWSSSLGLTSSRQVHQDSEHFISITAQFPQTGKRSTSYGMLLNQMFAILKDCLKSYTTYIWKFYYFLLQISDKGKNTEADSHLNFGGKSTL